MVSTSTGIVSRYAIVAPANDFMRFSVPFSCFSVCFARGSIEPSHTRGTLAGFSRCVYIG